MVAKVKTFAFNGIDVLEVDVQVKISSGSPLFTIVGLPDKALGESKERIRGAILSTGLSWPFDRITVNLAPADIQKEGSHFDLAIAVGIMIELGVLSREMADEYFILGELGLDGSIAPVNGIIAAGVGTLKRNCGIICPKDNAKEASWAGDLEVVAANNLVSLLNHLKGEQLIITSKSEKIFSEETYPDFSEVKGQDLAKRALEIAAAGGHNLLMVGPPGTGKSMLASRLPGILPVMKKSEILELNMINSISGRNLNGNLAVNRPYRDPHHSCSMPAMVGGGSKVKPGEVSLAHNGILFLDELAEFPRQVLDSLRQPLETASVSISRANSHVTYPANFQLIAAMNPCKCGYLGDDKKECRKAPICGQDYQNKISGPFLDRIDIMIEVGQIDFFNKNLKNGENSSEIAKRVKKTRDLQENRYKNEEKMQKISKINAKLSGEMLEKFCHLEETEQEILKNATKKMGLSMRGLTRILRVARTIADLEESPKITQSHLFEAISYRRKL